MDDVRGPARTAAAEPLGTAVADDRPRRVRLPRLRRPATWSLALGAASLVPLSVDAFRAQRDRMVSLSGSTSGSGLSVDLGVVLFLAAGCLACVWLVRVQSLLARSVLVRTTAYDVGLWLMWAFPVLNWILPGVRISAWDKAIHGRRSWAVVAWAALWAPFSTAQVWLAPDASTVPSTWVSWAFVATAAGTFALWAATVVRLTWGCEVVAHRTGVDA